MFYESSNVNFEKFWNWYNFQFEKRFLIFNTIQDQSQFLILRSLSKGFALGRSPFKKQIV